MTDDLRLRAHTKTIKKLVEQGAEQADVLRKVFEYAQDLERRLSAGESSKSSMRLQAIMDTLRVGQRLEIPVGTDKFGVGTLTKLHENYITGDDASSGILGASWESQSFTVASGESHYLTHVSLLLHRVGTPGTVTVSIRAVDGDEIPTGSDLVSTTFDGDMLPTDTDGEWWPATFASPIYLDAGTQYAIVVRATGGDANNRILWHVDITSPTYSGGVRGTSPDSGANWGAWDGTDNDNYDNMFEEWGSPRLGIWIEEADFRYIDKNGVERILRGGVGGVVSIVTKTGDYTLTTSDDVVLVDASGGNRTITLPAVSGIAGTVYEVKKIDSSGNTVTLDGNGSETIDGQTTQVITAQYTSITVITDGSAWYIR